MRGQTTLDFSIGITVFLAVIISIFAFAPGILTPFTLSGQTDAVTVDRTADYLVQDALGSPENPYLLDRGCTVAFFNRTADESPEEPFGEACQYSNQTLSNQLGFEEYETINITVIGNLSSEKTQLYWDSSSRELTDVASTNTTLAIGDTVGRNRETTSATRLVRLHGEDVILRVVVS